MSRVQPISQRLNIDSQVSVWLGENRCAKLFNRAYKYFEITRETTESFRTLFFKVQYDLPKLPKKIGPLNTLMMCMIWPRLYPTYAHFYQIFFNFRSLMYPEVSKQHGPFCTKIFKMKFFDQQKKNGQG